MHRVLKTTTNKALNCLKQLNKPIIQLVDIKENKAPTLQDLPEFSLSFSVVHSSLFVTKVAPVIKAMHSCYLFQYQNVSRRVYKHIWINRERPAVNISGQIVIFLMYSH